MNLITALQSSAHSCRFRFPNDIASMQTYGEARGGYEKRPFPFMGLRRFIIDFLGTPITQQMIDDAENCCPDYDKDMWQYILDRHNGFLPIKISGVKEGFLANPCTVLWTIDCVDERCAMLPVMIDKLIVSYVWFESTICQKIKSLRCLIEGYCELAGLPRTMSSFLAGGSTQVGDERLSDVVNALIFMFFSQSVDHSPSEYLNKYYETSISGCRARTSDHNSIIAFDSEYDCLETLLERHKHEWFSILSDSKDYIKFFDEVIPAFRQQIADREMAMSIGLDCDQHCSILTYALKSLSQTFGVERNSLGFKNLIAPIVIAQLEDLSFDEIQIDIAELIEQKWSPINFFWHISDHYIQEKLSRSSNGFVHKVCHVSFKDGTKRDICKQVKQNPSKKTKKGLQKVLDPHVYYDHGQVDFDSFVDVQKRLCS